MKKVYLFVAITLTAFAGLFVFYKGCISKKATSPSKVRTMLRGKWAIRNAESDGKKTSLLEGTTFEFTEEGKILTNLPMLNEGEYEVLEEEKIVQKSPIKVEYIIEQLDSSNLVLAFNLKERDFKLSFQKEE